MQNEIRMGNLTCFFLYRGRPYFASFHGELVFQHPITDGKIWETSCELIDDDEFITTIIKEDFEKYGITQEMLDEFKSHLPKE